MKQIETACISSHSFFYCFFPLPSSAPPSLHALPALWRKKKKRRMTTFFGAVAVAGPKRMAFPTERSKRYVQRRGQK